MKYTISLLQFFLPSQELFCGLKIMSGMSGFTPDPEVHVLSQGPQITEKLESSTYSLIASEGPGSIHIMYDLLTQQ